MKTISLKVPDELYERIEANRKRENKNRTSFVMEAVAEYNKKLEREELRKKLEEEIESDRNHSKEVISEWDVAVGDGLDDLDDDFSKH